MTDWIQWKRAGPGRLREESAPKVAEQKLGQERKFSRREHRPSGPLGDYWQVQNGTRVLEGRCQRRQR